MLQPLIVSQYLMGAVSQNRDIFETDPTIEVTWFASRVSSPSHEKLTHFVRSPHLLHLECAIRTHTTMRVIKLWLISTRVTRLNSMHTRTCSTLPQMLENGIYFCEQENTLKEKKAEKLMKRREKNLLPISGSKICALSSAQTERHNVTGWWPVAFTGVMEGSTAKWSKQVNKWETQKELNRKYTHLNSTIPSSKACSSITRLRSWLPKATGPGSSLASGTRRRVMTACHRPLERLTSGSVDTSSASEKHGPSLAASGKEGS